jgi:formamidopyrimidine-DNA glycosylase
MTGDVKYYKKECSDPGHSAMIFSFQDGHKLAIIGVRKFGKVVLAEGREEFIETRGLGPDALSLDEEGFVEMMEAKRGRIKSALMDQKAISGIGNIYSDEILYHAGIKPDKKVSGLRREDLETVYEIMISVLTNAIENDVDPCKMPENYLIRRREAGAICGICGGKIENIKIGERSAYFCPKHQR